MDKDTAEYLRKSNKSLKKYLDDFQAHINKNTEATKKSLTALTELTKLSFGISSLLMEYLNRDDKMAQQFAQYLCDVTTSISGDEQKIKIEVAQMLLKNGFQSLLPEKPNQPTCPKFRIIEGGLSAKHDEELGVEPGPNSQ